MIYDLTFRMSLIKVFFLQHALFCHVYIRSVFIISVQVKMAEEYQFLQVIGKLLQLGINA